MWLEPQTGWDIGVAAALIPLVQVLNGVDCKLLRPTFYESVHTARISG